jgi:hypothetical protein
MIMGFLEKLKGGFMGENFTYPVAGNALFVGVDINTGETTEKPSISIEDFQKQITFMSKEYMVEYARQFN